MKDRIVELMRVERLTPSKLAEQLGTQPSSISHLLAGRNKPGFDFIANMLLKFPALNPYWLILGQLPMYNDTEGGAGTTISVSGTTVNGSGTIINDSSTLTPDHTAQNRANATPTTASSLPSPAATTTVSPAVTPAIPILTATPTTPEPAAIASNPPAMPIPSPTTPPNTATDTVVASPIEQVMVLMSDGTFKTYTQSK